MIWHQTTSFPTFNPFKIQEDCQIMIYLHIYMYKTVHITRSTPNHSSNASDIYDARRLIAKQTVQCPDLFLLLVVCSFNLALLPNCTLSGSETSFYVLVYHCVIVKHIKLLTKL